MSDERSGANGEQPHGGHHAPIHSQGSGGSGSVQPERTPLAPPLYTPAPTVSPPYAQAPEPNSGGIHTDAPYGGQPGAPAALGGQPAPGAASGGRTTLIVAIVAAIVIIGGFLGFGVLASVMSSSPSISSGQGVGSGEERQEDEPPANDTEAMLEEKLDEYRTARDDGSLWEQIPDTQFNRTAVVAFLFFLTDMKVAASWGIDRDTATEYEEEVAELERRLLAEEPLGSNIEIAFSEDRIFRYDGETGEGGYFEE